MRVLVACEYSGVVREAFRKLGHDAISCDLLPTQIPGPHYQGDVFDLLNWNPLMRFDYTNGDSSPCWFPSGPKGNVLGFDLMIAHPPCTYLSNSGVTWLYKNQERWKDLISGAVFFRKLMESNIPKICIENPIQHKYAKAIIDTPHTQIIQPWQFGHAESKATCLWLKGLAPLIETENVFEKFKSLPKNEAQRLHYLPPSKDRWKIRSTTFQGIADAMAEQWGSCET